MTATSVAATATEVAPKTKEYCQANPGKRLHLTAEGSIYKSEGKIGIGPQVDTADFDASVTFYNPSTDAWNYGLMFRQPFTDTFDLFVVRGSSAEFASSTWSHYFRRGDASKDTSLASGYLGGGGVNGQRQAHTLRLVVTGRTGTAYLDGKELTKLTLDGPFLGSNYVMPVFGFFNTSGVTLEYSNFLVKCP